MTATMTDLRDIHPGKFKKAALALLEEHGKVSPLLAELIRRAPPYLVLIGLFDAFRLPYLDLEIDGRIIRILEVKGSA